MQPNFPQQQGTYISPEEAELYGELIRAVVHEIARNMPEERLNEFARHQSYSGLAAALRRHNDETEHKIRNREHLKAAPAAGRSRRRADGSVDHFNQSDATARTRQIFEAALGKKGR